MTHYFLCVKAMSEREEDVTPCGQLLLLFAPFHHCSIMWFTFDQFKGRCLLLSLVLGPGIVGIAIEEKRKIYLEFKSPQKSFTKITDRQKIESFTLSLLFFMLKLCGYCIVRVEPMKNQPDISGRKRKGEVSFLINVSNLDVCSLNHILLA